ncbi:MAG: hypothetical protein HQL87_11900 [Magnetococcales bacterium]|nr:hypothetical protein [Magnetococcales bacterium]
MSGVIALLVAMGLWAAVPAQAATTDASGVQTQQTTAKKHTKKAKRAKKAKKAKAAAAPVQQ